MVSLSGLLLVLFDATSSGGTVTATVSLPSAAGVNGAKLTVVWPPQAAREAISLLSENVSAPVMLRPTGRLVRALEPLLVTTAWTV